MSNRMTANEIATSERRLREFENELNERLLAAISELIFSGYIAIEISETEIGTYEWQNIKK